MTSIMFMVLFSELLLNLMIYFKMLPNKEFIVREDMSGILILWDFHIRSSLT